MTIARTSLRRAPAAARRRARRRGPRPRGRLRRDRRPRSRRTCPAAATTSPARPRSPPTRAAIADFAAREAGVVAGLAIAELVFPYVLGDDVEITDRLPDGTRVAAGDVVMRVAGPTRGLLTAERTALNFASHLSGVATATAAWVAALAGTRARVLDTRKTLPGLPRPAEVRRALRRRGQPPVQPVRPGDGQGQPRARGGRRRAGLRGGPGGATPDLRSRSRSPTSTSCASCSTPAATGSCSTTCDRRRWPRRCAITDGRATPRGLRRADPRAGPRGGRDRASTSSPSARSPTRSGSSTSAWTSQG